MITDALFYYNNKSKYSTTKMELREVLNYYKNKEMIEKLTLNVENSRKKFIKKLITILEIVY